MQESDALVGATVFVGAVAAVLSSTPAGVTLEDEAGQSS
jgi:hypothetical protein